MPVILSSENYDLWLDPGFRDVAAVTEMLQPFDADRMRRYPVSEHVNNVATDDRECSEPVDRRLLSGGFSDYSLRLSVGGIAQRSSVCSL